MCDYSLQALASRPAAVGDKLITKDFGTGSHGFAPADGSNVAVCVRPGTELAFDSPLKTMYSDGWFGQGPSIKGEHRTAIFRQINKEQANIHHDALELPDGQIAMLTMLEVGIGASVLQLPAAPKNDAEAKEQERAEFVG